MTTNNSNLSDMQIKNWRSAFPFLVFLSDDMVTEVSKAIQMKLSADLYNQKVRERITEGIREQFFHLIRVGSIFLEGGHKKLVSRVTDRVFDSVDQVTGEIKVRNLEILRSKKFNNEFSIISL